jgi:hypothetical protein
MEIIGTVVVLLVFAALVGMRLANFRSSTLVLQEFKVDRLPSRRAKKEVEIVGRLQGIIAFCLSLLGFSPITRFFIAGSELRCESSSLFGQRLQFIPLRSVSNVSAGVHKPFAAIVFAVLLPLFGIYILVVAQSWIGLGLCLLGSVILILVYVLSKKFYLEIHSQGGPSIGLLFKPNVIEGVQIDVERALSIVTVIRDLVVESNRMPTPNTIDNFGATITEPSTEWISEPAAEIASELFQPPPLPNEDLEAKKLFAQARDLSKEGKTDLAVAVLREIISKYPNSEAATLAKRSLQRSGLPEN